VGRGEVYFEFSVENCQFRVFVDCVPFMEEVQDLEHGFYYFVV
jgi:hypothetical protein